MRMRSGVLLVAVAGLLSAASSASASHCGAVTYNCTTNAGDCQTGFSSQQAGSRVCYKLVYDTVLEKRWHTCYKTVTETVMKPVCKTCYRDETKTVCKPCETIEYQECKYNVCKRVPVTCMKECCEVVCKPVQEVHCHKACHQVQKVIQEQHVREVAEMVSRQVQEVHCHKACHQICKCIDETCYKDVCCTECRDCVETHYKCCKKHVWKEYCTSKTVKHKCGEWVTEQVCVPKKLRCVEECREVCFDPCSCKTICKPWKKCKSWSCDNGSEVKCKKVWRDTSYCEQVPDKKCVRETVYEKVPYTVCKKVSVSVVKKVPVTTQRCVRGAYVDEKGNGHECEGPGRTFKEGAQICKDVCHTTCKTVTECVKRKVPYTTCRTVCGAYVDEKGVGHDDEGPGRKFVEGAQVCRDICTTTTRMVQETVRKQVPVTTYQNVTEVCTKKVPVKVCKMVPTTVTCRVPYTVTESQPCCVTRKVKVCEEIEVPVKRCRKVPVVVCDPCVTCKPACDPCKPSCEPCKPACVPCKPSCGDPCKPSCDSGCCKPSMSCYRECRVRCEESTSLLQRLFGRMGCGKSSCGKSSCGN